MSDMIDVRIFILDELYTVVELVDRGLSSKVSTLLPILPIFGRANFVLILLYSIATMSVTLRLPTAFRNNVRQSIWFDINSYWHCQTKSDCLCSLPLLPFQGWVIFYKNYQKIYFFCYSCKLKFNFIRSERITVHWKNLVSAGVSTIIDPPPLIRWMMVFYIFK